MWRLEGDDYIYGDKEYLRLCQAFNVTPAKRSNDNATVLSPQVVQDIHQSVHDLLDQVRRWEREGLTGRATNGNRYLESQRQSYLKAVRKLNHALAEPDLSLELICDVINQPGGTYHMSQEDRRPPRAFLSERVKLYASCTETPVNSRPILRSPEGGWTCEQCRQRAVRFNERVTDSLDWMCQNCKANIDRELAFKRRRLSVGSSVRINMFDSQSTVSSEQSVQTHHEYQGLSMPSEQDLDRPSSLINGPETVNEHDEDSAPNPREQARAFLVSNRVEETASRPSDTYMYEDSDSNSDDESSHSPPSKFSKTIVTGYSYDASSRRSGFRCRRAPTHSQQDSDDSSTNLAQADDEMSDSSTDSHHWQQGVDLRQWARRPLNGKNRRKPLGVRRPPTVEETDTRDQDVVMTMEDSEPCAMMACPEDTNDNSSESAMMTYSESDTELDLNDSTLAMALNAPIKLRNCMAWKDYFKVVWDSGATIAVTNCLDDFDGPVTPPTLWRRLTGIARNLEIKGQGQVTWLVMGTNGKLRKLKIPALYIPQA